MAGKKTVIVTGASQGIGAAVVQAFLDRGYQVVATSRNVSKAGLTPSPNLELVDGDIGHAETGLHRPRSPGSARLTMSSTMRASSHRSLFWTTRLMSFAVSFRPIWRGSSS